MVDQLHSDPSSETTSERAVRRTNRPVRPIVLVVGLVVGLVAGLAIGWLIGRSGDDDEASDVPADVEATVDEWRAAVLAEDPYVIRELYAEDAVWYDEAGDDRFEGRDGAFRGWNIFGLVDEVVAVEAIAVTEDVAVVSWTFDGVSDWYLTGLSVLEFDGGEIAAETVYYDSAQGP